MQLMKLIRCFNAWQKILENHLRRKIIHVGGTTLRMKSTASIPFLILERHMNMEG